MTDQILNMLNNVEVKVYVVDAHLYCRFPGHPANGEKAAGLALEVVGTVTGPAHPEVGNLDGLAPSDQTIPAVDILLEHLI